MKKHILCSAFIFLVTILFCNFVFSQKAPAAKKFDEFADYPAEEGSPLYDRTTRFGERIKKEAKTQKAIIIFYNQRKVTYPGEAASGKNWAEKASNILKYNYEMKEERIVLIDGGYREFPSLEFWIAPQDAEIPEPTPTVDKSEVIYCPSIWVAGDGFRHDRKKPLKFSAALRDTAEGQSFPMEWSVSAGKIVKGQGTKQIEIDISETNAKRITAGVIVKNLPPECDSHAFNSTEIGLFAHKSDEFSHIQYSDLSARLDGFFISILHEPDMTGHIIIYGSRKNNKKDVAAIIKSINLAILFRRFDKSRLKIVDGGFREDMWVELYLLPHGVEPPKPVPTLNAEFVEAPVKKKPRRRR